MYQSPESIAEMLHAISATGEGTAAVLRCQTGRWVIHGILQADHQFSTLIYRILL